MTETNTPETPAVVLFYPTGIVHFRNLELLQRYIPGLRFRVIIEHWVQEKAAEVLAVIPEADRVPVVKDRLPDAVWSETDILFLSMAYPNPFRLSLVYEAARRNIPIMAIEEVNQLALNDGFINHYFLPIDYLGVPSPIERERFLSLGLPDDSVYVTGWPFFNEPQEQNNGAAVSIREQYQIPPAKKCALLVLGSLKESDIVSLETRLIRRQILAIVTAGLPDGYQLLIKPHPIETPEALKEIQNLAPQALVLDPKLPIEPLLAQSDLVINRGNSQVVLLAMWQQIPLIVVSAGLQTIFSQQADYLICDSVESFQQRVLAYDNGEPCNYHELLALHFPLTQEEAATRVVGLFEEALERGVDQDKRKFHYLSLLFAFLGDREKALELLERFPEQPVTSLLKSLYAGKITFEQFPILMESFPGIIPRWHLQALLVRELMTPKNSVSLAETVPLLMGFDGQVNPHYFIAELVMRIELEYQAGRQDVAAQLMAAFYEQYAVYPYYKQAFAMLRFVYHNHNNGHKLRKKIWLCTHFFSNYTRKYIKDNRAAKKALQGEQ